MVPDFEIGVERELRVTEARKRRQDGWVFAGDLSMLAEEMPLVTESAGGASFANLGSLGMANCSRLVENSSGQWRRFRGLRREDLQ
jgi:hypothetical protein